MIQIKSPREIELLRDANRIVAEILAELRAEIAPGISTLERKSTNSQLWSPRAGGLAKTRYGIGHRANDQ